MCQTIRTGSIKLQLGNASELNQAKKTNGEKSTKISLFRKENKFDKILASLEKKNYKAQINEDRTEQQRLHNESLLLERDYKGLLWTIVVNTPDNL